MPSPTGKNHEFDKYLDVFGIVQTVCQCKWISKSYVSKQGARAAHKAHQLKLGEYNVGSSDW